MEESSTHASLKNAGTILDVLGSTQEFDKQLDDDKSPHIRYVKIFSWLFLGLALLLVHLKLAALAIVALLTCIILFVVYISADWAEMKPFVRQPIEFNLDVLKAYSRFKFGVTVELKEFNRKDLVYCRDLYG